MASTELKLAKWLLNHFGCSPNNDAIIGDLDERTGKAVLISGIGDRHFSRL
jgi:hypothetical protein